MSSSLIDYLITYISLNRFSDVPKYFEQNYQILKPKRARVYINDCQEPLIGDSINPSIEVKASNLGDWNLGWMQILQDLKQDSNFKNAYVVDSDNVLPEDFQEIDDEMERKGYHFYTVQDNRPVNLLKTRSRRVDENIWKYKIRGSWKSVFFIGPKQGVRMSRDFVLSSLSGTAILQIKAAMEKLHPKVRQYISDDYTLGMLLYYSSISETPWIEEGSHFGRQRPRLDVVTNALAHSMFARRMLSYRKDKWLLWYYLRNKASLIARSLLV
jgi:hypothetical protein